MSKNIFTHRIAFDHFVAQSLGEKRINEIIINSFFDALRKNIRSKITTTKIEREESHCFADFQYDSKIVVLSVPEYKRLKEIEKAYLTMIK